MRKLFSENRIDVFIGYGESSVPGRALPMFITSADEVDKLVWNEFCVNSLAVYLPRFFEIEPRQKEKKFPRVGLAAKGCDGRAVVGLIKENQMPRESVYIVGIACEGMSELDGGTRREREVCAECEYRAPAVYDVLIEGDGSSGEKKPARFNRIEEFRKKPIEERWNYFVKEMAKCIRCYACRNVCPTCYCKECFTDETQPKWHGVTNDMSDIIYFHLGRLFHQAGRCVDCGSCSWVCPMGIDLRLFLQGLLKDVKELYGYEAGLSIEEPPPLTVFKPDDVQKFITEP